MTTAAAPRIEYDDRFAARPELKAAAEEAMRDLDEKLGTNPLVPPPSVIRWAVRPLDTSSVELSMADEGTGLRAVRVFPAQHMADPQNRDIHSLRVWSALLSERSRVNMARLDRKIADYRKKLEGEPE